MTVRRLRWISIAATVAAVSALSVLSVLARVRTDQAGQAGASAVVPAPLAVGTALAKPPKVPPIRLIDEHGKPFSLDAWRGKWVVLAPSMTLCHEVCPMTTGALVALTTRLAQAGLAGQVKVAEVTVDPWRDTPRRLRAYRRLTSANFSLLTGTQSQIRRLWKFFGVYYRRVPQGHPADADWLTHRAESFDVAHTDGLFFLDPAGRERIANVGMPNVGGHLAGPLRGLLNEQGRQNLARPELPWTAAEALDDIYWLTDRPIPASQAPVVAAPSAAAARAALAGSPSTLAGLHAQAAQLLGSERELQTRLNGLRGFPVVVNAWASWCGPCRAEFPLFAAAAARFGRRVAFLGVDTNDAAGDARAFLSAHPVSYPSYQSSSSQLASLAVIEGLPTTLFISRSGKVVDVHAYQYDTLSTLANDVQRHALGR